MFEVPDAKRVRREDLVEDESSQRDSDEERLDVEMRACLHARIAQSLGLAGGDAKAPIEDARARTAAPGALRVGGSQVPGEVNDEEDDDKDGDDESLGEFEFRLFRTTTGSTAKVVLQADNETRGEGGIVAKRPTSYYFVTNLDEKRQEYKIVSVSGEDVLARSRRRLWGLELPWKVTKISTTRKATACDWRAGAGTDVSLTKKKRPGKKRRLVLRKRSRAEKEEEELAAKNKREKEEQVQDKRKRLNRAKKLRRRAKDKEKKLTSADDAEGPAAGGPG